MYIEKEKITPREIKNISLVFKLILVTIFIILFFMLWKIQIVEHEHYTTLAISNIYKTIDVKAPRGLIVDRNQKVLIENQINFSLFLIRENIQDQEKTIQFARIITGFSEDELKKRINKFKKYPNGVCEVLYSELFNLSSTLSKISLVNSGEASLSDK